MFCAGCKNNNSMFDNLNKWAWVDGYTLPCRQWLYPTSLSESEAVKYIQNIGNCCWHRPWYNYKRHLQVFITTGIDHKEQFLYCKVQTLPNADGHEPFACLMRAAEEEKLTQKWRNALLWQTSSQPKAWPSAEGGVCPCRVIEGATGCPAAEDFSRNVEVYLM